MRADRLPRLERVALRLLDLAPLDEDLGKTALALAERPPILERLEDPDRVAEAALGSREVAATALDPAVVVGDTGERPGVAGLGEVLRGPVEPGRGIVEPAA